MTKQMNRITQEDFACLWCNELKPTRAAGIFPDNVVLICKDCDLEVNKRVHDHDDYFEPGK